MFIFNDINNGGQLKVKLNSFLESCKHIRCFKVASKMAARNMRFLFSFHVGAKLAKKAWV